MYTDNNEEGIPIREEYSASAQVAGGGKIRINK